MRRTRADDALRHYAHADRGRELEIFLDREAIGWGDLAQPVIRASVRSATVLLGGDHLTDDNPALAVQIVQERQYRGVREARLRRCGAARCRPWPASTHRLEASDVPIRRAMMVFREGLTALRGGLRVVESWTDLPNSGQ